MSAGDLWGYIIGFIGLVVGLASWLRNRISDTSVQATWMGKVDAKLDNISINLSKLGELPERVAVLERDLKTAFNYIDEQRKENTELRNELRKAKEAK